MAKLLAYVTTDISDAERALLCQRVELSGTSRTWASGPPVLVDEVEDESELTSSDAPLRTIGALLDVGEPTKDEADMAHYRDARAFIDTLASFSAEVGCELEFLLDETYVGDIVSGRMSALLSEGLLDEWARTLWPAGEP